MIILDEEDEHQDVFTHATVRYPEKAAGRSSSSLPDYEASQAQHRLNVKNFNTPDKRPRSARLLRATLYALAIYVALSAIIAIPIVMTRRQNSSDYHRVPNPPPNLWINSNPIISPPPSFSSASLTPFDSSPTSDCSSWQKIVNNSWILQASLNQTFPTTASIAIRSNFTTDDYQVISGLSGSLTVDINPDHKATETVIKLRAIASHPTLLQQTNVCIYNNGSEDGLTIYAPSNLTDSHTLSFDVQLLFPATSSPYVVPDLTTYLPQFSQHFAPLSKYVTFTQVSIFGTQFDITCESIEAPIVGIKNIRAPISGTFNVSSSLILDTINGAIISNITLTSVTQAPALILDTGNAPIHADISLSSPSASIPGPFFIRAKTFSAPIQVSIVHKTPTSLPLILFASNFAATTNVTLDPLYQGRFEVHSKLAPVTLNSSQPVVLDSQSYERLSGCIGTVGRPSRMPGDGKVEVISALGPISLTIGRGSL